MRFLLVVLGLFVFAIPAQAAGTIELTQTDCQFIKPEKGDKHYQAGFFEACQMLNKKTEEKRLSQATTLTLKPGKYVFRIHNRDVPYVLGFWLRGKGLSRLTLPSTSGGGIKTGAYKDYKITLEEGEYVYSCPLNPTPDYRLSVKP